MTATIFAILQKEIRLAKELLALEKEKSNAIISANMERLKQTVQVSTETANRLADLQKNRQVFAKTNMRNSMNRIKQKNVNDRDPATSQNSISNDQKTPKSETPIKQPASLQEILEAMHLEDPNIPQKKIEEIRYAYRDTLSRLGNQIAYNQKILERSNNLIKNLLDNIREDHQKKQTDKTYLPLQSTPNLTGTKKNNDSSLLLEAKA